jgi:predicted RNA binding protein YcfA (HicA-like mRNA interferase family)
MPKLPVLKPKDLIKKLEKIGFVKDRQSGSHIIMYHPITKRRAIIAYHLKEIKRGTLNSLLKEACIDRSELLK